MAANESIDNVMSVVRKALISEDSNAEIREDKWPIIEEVYNTFSILAAEQDTVKIKIRPALDSAHVVVQGSELKIDSDGIQMLRECLPKCRGFFVEQSLLTADGALSTSVLIKQICKE